jgi:hypothetical protein
MRGLAVWRLSALFRPMPAADAWVRASAVWTVLALSFLAACNPPPVEQARLYADTTSKTRDAGGLILDRISPIIAGATDGSAQDCGPDAATGIPRCFDQHLVAGSSGTKSDPPEVAIHRLALDLTAAYAELLAVVAEGRSTAEVQTQAGVAADIASTLLGITGVGAPAAVAIAALKPQLQALAGQLEAARAGQIVRQAVTSDKETIKALLKALEDETPKIYQIYLKKRQLDLLAAARARDRAAVDAVTTDLKAFHAALDAYVRLLRASAAALDVLAREVQQPTRASPQAVQTALKQAIEARAEAQVLWNTIRQLDPSRR